MEKTKNLSLHLMKDTDAKRDTPQVWNKNAEILDEAYGNVRSVVDAAVDEAVDKAVDAAMAGSDMTAIQATVTAAANSAARSAENSANALAEARAARAATEALVNGSGGIGGIPGVSGYPLTVVFPNGSAGKEYTVTGGEDETYTGIVPEGLVITVVVKKPDAPYTVTTTVTEDGEERDWTGDPTSGSGSGAGSVTIQAMGFCHEFEKSDWRESEAREDFQYVLDIQFPEGSVGKEYTVTGGADEHYSGKVQSGNKGKEFVLWPDTEYRIQMDGWTGTATSEPLKTYAEIRIPKSVHGVTPTTENCICSIRGRFNDEGNVEDYGTESEVQALHDLLLENVRQALEENNANPGTHPTAADGHVILTWEQVQCLILEGQLLPVEEAAALAEQKHFNWKDVDTTGVPESVGLDDILTAAYTPALGGITTAYDALFSVAVIQGLRFRHFKDGYRGTSSKVWWRYGFDRNEYQSTWASHCCSAAWDLETEDLVIHSGQRWKDFEPFPGDILVVC